MSHSKSLFESFLASYCFSALSRGILDIVFFLRAFLVADLFFLCLVQNILLRYLTAQKGLKRLSRADEIYMRIEEISKKD